MADISIEQLSKLVGITSKELLAQLKEAGVAVTQVDQTISDDEKRQLLLHLKQMHGAPEPAKRSKITFNRKKVGVVKQGKKSVSVEFRAKRTYVKPSTVEDKAIPEDNVLPELEAAPGEQLNGVIVETTELPLIV